MVSTSFRNITRELEAEVPESEAGGVRGGDDQWEGRVPNIEKGRNKGFVDNGNGRGFHVG